MATQISNGVNYHQIALWVLRLGLAVTFLYSGIDHLLNPSKWLIYFPLWFKNLLPMSPLTFLKIQGLLETLLALSFLTGWMMRWAAILAVLEIMLIFIFYGFDAITFRDGAILGAALSLFFFCCSALKVNIKPQT